jgi:murein DD-endopeptidase MepM/ murein hydrolase activator NlpD
MRILFRLQQAAPFIYPLNKKETPYYKFKTPYAPGSVFAGTPHPGVDFHEREGAQVHAVADGTVLYNRFDSRGYGQYVVLEHTLLSGQKLYSLYGHLEQGSATHLKPGTVIKQGAVVGTEGQTGAANNIPHLHFEIKKTNELGLYRGLNNSNIDTYFYDPYLVLGSPQYQFRPLAN